MALLDPNTLIGIINGKLGNLVFARTKDGRIIVRHRPVRTAEATGPELANQSRFTQALAYVTRIRPQPAEYAVYQAAAKLKGNRACDLAHADFRHPPEIRDIDLRGYTGKPGDILRIQAVDDFEVSSVVLTLTDVEGVLLEYGAAVLDEASSRWHYVTQVPAPLSHIVATHITVSDRPANAVTKTLHHALINPT